MPMLSGKRALITGAARGIGLAAAKAFLREGAAVCIGDVDAEALSAVQAEFAETAGDVSTLQLDVGSDRAASDTGQALADRWGGLDVLVNNAAILDSAPTPAIVLDRFAAVIDINLTGALRMTQALLPLLRQGTDPSIINTVSTQAFFGQPNSGAYASAKAGLMNLTRVMAIDLGSEGIRVNAVAPGFIDTRMALNRDGMHEHQSETFRKFYIDQGRIPLRRPGTPDDCAGAFVFLASAMSAYTTGQAIFVDGGLSVTY